MNLSILNASKDVFSQERETIAVGCSWQDFSNSPFAMAPDNMEICEEDVPRDGLIDFEGPVPDQASLPLLNFLRGIMAPVPTEIIDGLNIMGGFFDAKLLLDFILTREVSQFLVVVKSTLNNLAHLEKFVQQVANNRVLCERCIIIYVTVDENAKEEILEIAKDLLFDKTVEHAIKGVDDFVSQMLSCFGFGQLISKDRFNDWKVIWNLYTGKRLLVTIFKGESFISDTVAINLV
jgi:hypothetical protein